MSLNILIVKSEKDFISQFNDLIALSDEEFDVTCVSNRKDAMSAIKEATFDRIITALKIPRISDGYIFLSHILKVFGEDKVIVVVDEKTDEVKRSINHMGAKHLHSASDVAGLLNFLVPVMSTTGSVVAEKSDNGVSLDDLAADVEKVQEALGLAMGPAAGMIFSEVIGEWKDTDTIQELINLIEIEIDDEGKIALFRQNIQKISVTAS